MQFRKIKGYNDLKRRLIQTVLDNRVSHAQMFLGAEGTEKLAMAVAYAQFLSCTDKQGLGPDSPIPMDSCGVCPSCVKYEKLIHPDLHFVFPVATTKEVKSQPISKLFLEEWRNALLDTNFYINLNEWYEFLGIENKQGNINVHEANNIIKTIHLKPYESSHKVVIIWMSEKIHHAAAPKLLKSLEEPPQNTIFILISENHAQILATIRSRTQLVKFYRHSDDVVYEALREEFDLPHEKIQQAVGLAEGSIKRARKIIEDNDSEEFYFVQFRELMQKSYLHDVVGMKDKSIELSSIGRERIRQLLTYGLRIIRLCFLSSLENHQLVKSYGKELDFVTKFIPFVNHGNAQQFAVLLEDAITHIMRNGNARIILYDLQLQSAGLLRKKK
jgi:DNA polymerase-3 subunit delta'